MAEQWNLEQLRLFVRVAELRSFSWLPANSVRRSPR